MRNAYTVLVTRERFEADIFEPILVSGATKTTNAYANAIKAALESFEILTAKGAK